VSPERAIAGTRVRVREHHRRESLQGMTGKVLGRYGRRAHVAVDVRLSDGASSSGRGTSRRSRRRSPLGGGVPCSGVTAR
jgi:hypothetical protein